MRVRLSATFGAVSARYLGDDDLITIGSHSANHLVLGEPTVSRFHAHIEHDGIGHCLTDLGSTNGCFIHHLRIGSAYLEPGMRFRLGEVELTFDLVADADGPHPTPERWGELVVRSAPMHHLLDRLQQLARSESSVLFIGERGVGKDVAAAALHRHSARSQGPFVVVDCAELRELSIDSELFGHERGAFLGADEPRVGAFERADGGTLLLDDVDQLPLPTQDVLLAVLERRRVQRLGSDHLRPFDVRILATTRGDLPRLCNQRLFRDALYARLAVVTLRVPPLRERAEDLGPLLESLLQEHGAHMLVDDRLLERLRRQRWAENGRELRTMVERAVVRAPVVSPPAGRVAVPLLERGATADEPYKLARANVLERFDRAYLRRVLRHHGGDVRKAARGADVDAEWMGRQIKRYAIDLTALQKGRSRG